MVAEAGFEPHARLRFPKFFARYRFAEFRPLPLLFARFFRHWRRSQTSPSGYEKISGVAKCLSLPTKTTTVPAPSPTIRRRWCSGALPINILLTMAFVSAKQHSQAKNRHLHAVAAMQMSVYYLDAHCNIERISNCSAHITGFTAVAYFKILLCTTVKTLSCFPVGL